ncbi:MAG TPA: hypothetical protein VM369_11895 [Candidatus Binatia bacterium]|nr:hypothetical protein [Candidatus Binatia bacterium]
MRRLAAWACALPLVAGAAEYRIAAQGADYRVQAAFRHFDGRALQLAFSLPRAAVSDSLREFGYAAPEPGALAKTCAGCTQAQYDQRMLEFYRGRGLRVEREGRSVRLSVDVAAAVARNRPRVRNAAAALDAMAGSDEAVLGAAVAFVQTALAYARPPPVEGGRQILDFYPPPRLLEAGRGDCDSKAALLAAMLASFPGVRMVGVHVPRHYLVGIGRVPRPGEAFVEYDGAPYVLIEASGPAWLPPGQIAETTQSALATMDGVRIDPLF